MTHTDRTPAPLPALPATTTDSARHLEFNMFECRTTGCDWRSPWFARRDPNVPAHDHDHTTTTGHERFYLYSLSRTHSEVWTRRPRR
ncbi:MULTISPECIES: hypothetical protein [Nocardia]|uniref:hypothetical protein n=1 Tax=Nocardia TaxID=1817 RepID=UPI002457D6C6|nr:MULTISPECIES: hypothetical protein [Nocardia]